MKGIGLSDLGWEARRRVKALKEQLDFHKKHCIEALKHGEEREADLKLRLLRATNIFTANYPYEPRKSAQQRWLVETVKFLNRKE